MLEERKKELSKLRNNQLTAKGQEDKVQQQAHFMRIKNFHF
jgi:hypothetical protein